MTSVSYRSFPSRLALFAVLSTAAGCTHLPPPRIADAQNAPVPQPIRSADATTAEVQLDVLTFNIEGLGWPARRGRGASLAQIGETLARLRREGRAPDVVLIQEMFSAAAVRAVQAMGYPNMVVGPSRTQGKRMAGTPAMTGPFRWKKGETGMHLVGSGLAILSRYPIVAHDAEPFGKHRCAGLDCLSNKGMVHARITIPGVPQPIDLFDTHLNSQGASRVPAKRNGEAHRLQVGQLARFIDASAQAGAPAILGGDFNMRGSTERFDRFRSTSRNFTLVHQYCEANRALCDVRMSWDGDAPWLDTEDLQLFHDGALVAVRPVRVEAMFDGADGLPQLSDHDGFRVTYRLRWTPDAAKRPATG